MKQVNVCAWETRPQFFGSTELHSNSRSGLVHITTAKSLSWCLDIFRWQGSSYRHQHPLSPGTDAGHSDPGGGGTRVWRDRALYGVSPSPQDPWDPLHAGQGWCERAYLLCFYVQVLLCPAHCGNQTSVCEYIARYNAGYFFSSVLQAWSSRCWASTPNYSAGFVNPSCPTLTCTGLCR